ncbi:MAG: choice-of-anchor tandem repeat GloVer-containing protein [Verrucomicrobiota bacterium]
MKLQIKFAIALVLSVIATVVQAQPVLTTLHHFSYGAGGDSPAAGLTLGADGSFYGTTRTGGLTNLNYGSGLGTVFRLTPTGELTTLVQFDDANGRYPLAELIQAADGSFYGTTAGNQWSPTVGGTVFKMTTNGDLTTLARLDTPWRSSAAPLIPAADGFFYGTTAGGGDQSSVFRIATNGGLATVFAFPADGTVGWDPLAGLVAGPDGGLYGSTTYGGITNSAFPGGAGTLFKVTTNDKFTHLFSFNGTNGAMPQAELTLGSDGNLYGTTSRGGITNAYWPQGMGTVFRMTPDGTVTTLAEFSFADGAEPVARLLEGADGEFYGTTMSGGDISVFSTGAGLIYKITTNGVMTTLHQFNETNGAHPVAGLVRGGDGNFYGTTGTGGTNHYGTIFKLQMLPFITGQPASQTNWSDSGVSFSASATGLPAPTFAWLKDGVPIVDSSHIYSVSNGPTSTLYIAFADWTDAGNYSLIASNVFGVATSSIASLTVLESAPAITAQPAARTNQLGSGALFTVTASGLPAPVIQWRKDGVPLADGGNISGATNATLMVLNVTAASAGKYSATVSNHAGSTNSADALLTVLPTLWPLPVEVGATNVFWITGGDAEWFADPGSAWATSGLISDSQETWLQTTVTGPVAVDFWWTVSSERNRDYLACYVDGSRWAQISGEVDKEENLTLGAGTHTLRWRYYKNSSGSGGADTGWLYSVAIIPFETRIISQPIAATNFAGTTATFTFAATGIPAPACQWRKNGTNLVDGGNVSGATSNRLTIANVTPDDAAVYSVVANNPLATVTSADASLTVWPAITLAEALNFAALWGTGGDADWPPEAVTTHDGAASARSGSITDNQSTWVQTSVTGPGTLSFWWKVSSEECCDHLTLYTNGVPAVEIGGEVDWRLQTVALGSGSHTLKWAYAKDGSVSAGLDAGWLDQVSFASGTPASIPLAHNLAGGQLILNWSNPAFSLESATNLAGPFATIPGATSPFTNIPTENQRFFRLKTP